jgi:molecular chaperone GrpE
VSELKNDRLRLLADMENVRNIARRDVDNAKAYAVQSFAKQLLGVVDTLSLAVSSVPAGSVDSNEALKTLYEGVSMTHHSLLKALSGQGVVQFGAAGDKYDPHLHEAMFEAEHETLAPEAAIRPSETCLRRRRWLWRRLEGLPTWSASDSS